MALGVGEDVSVSILVVDDSPGKRAMDGTVLAWHIELAPHPECVGCALGCGHDDIGPLANTESHYIRLVRLHLDEVVCDDSELVAVDGELLVGRPSGVDQAKKMLLSRLELVLR